MLEALLHGGVKGAVEHRAHAHALAAHKLVAGVDIAVRGDGHVFVARAAAGQALAKAGAAGEVHHEMKEAEPLVRIAAADHIFAAQTLVFLEHAGQVAFADGIVVAFVGDDRLDGELLKALVRQVQHVVSKVQIVAGEGAAQVVALLAAPPGEFLRLLDDEVIAALAVGGGAHAVVHLRPPVDGDDDVVHLAVEEVHDLVVHKHGVGGGGELEHLAVALLQLAAVGHDLPDDGEVHQRLAAEEVHLQVFAPSAVGHQPVQRLLARLGAEQAAAVHVVFAGVRKAVLAAQVAVVRGVQAHGLDHAAVGGLYVGVVVGRVQIPLVDELAKLGDGFLRFLAGVFFRKARDDIRISVLQKQGKRVVGDVVQRHDRAAAHVQRHFPAQGFKEMNHENKSS